jgi:signal transduction histidine kinase
MNDHDAREKEARELDPAGYGRRTGTFDSMPAPRSDVWPAPSRPSIEPPRVSMVPQARPSFEPPPPRSSPEVARSLDIERASWAIAALSQAEREGASDEAIVRAFVDALSVVAPELLAVVRLIDGEGGVPGRLGFVYANGKLLPDRRERLELSERSMVAYGVSDAAAQAASVTITPAPRSSFAVGDGVGAPLLDVPLLENGAILGIVSVEEPAEGAATGSATLVATLSALLGASLRNARLEREALFFRDYLAQTLEHASSPIFVLDRARIVRSANRAALSLVDAPRTEVLGRDFVGMLGAAARERALAALGTAFSGLATSALELDLVRNDHSAARVVWNVAPIFDEAGDARAAVVIGLDQTELHRLEEQIVHTEKLATLGQLAAGIIHELNNPLTSITVYAEYLHGKAQRAGADAGDVEKLRRIVEGANRMTRFTRDLVTYARPSNEETALSIREVALESARFCEHVLSETKVTLEADFDADLAPISGVRGQLQQVFVNLVTNACHALNDRGGGHVKIEAHRIANAAGEDEVVVRVSDDGPGISTEHLPHIFDPFFTTKREGRGTGLGLSIVRKIMKAHRGTIDVSTRHGAEGQSGTTFELRFPAL